LLRLNDGDGTIKLSGRHARVRNAGSLPRGETSGNGHGAFVPLGDAVPDEDGDFIFDPARGGPRIDGASAFEPETRRRYVEASRFGEVNTYYHLNRIAEYVAGILDELGVGPLPPVTAVVNAHSAVCQWNGITDGVPHQGGWRPFQGAHYRLPGPRSIIPELEPVSSDGEIHLGPGWQLLKHGAMVAAAGARYRHNASHNGAILYHEYGHHISRHTADFQGNAQRPESLQDNRKTPLDEGICDYWAATMLESPHIWGWHRRHDGEVAHRRTLRSTRTMENFDLAPNADPHSNGTIWAASLWDLRERIGDRRVTDRLIVTLLLLWKVMTDEEGLPSDAFIYGPESFHAALVLMLHADECLYAAMHRELILDVFARRGISPSLVHTHRPVPLQ